MTNNDIFLAKFGSITDEEWRYVLLESCYHSVVQSVPFPLLPDENLQRGYVGSSGVEAFQEAFLFYQAVKKYAGSLGISFGRNTRMLDFGVGWGRFYRVFLRDLATENFIGVDIDREAIDLCRKTIPYGRFEACDITPPLSLVGDGSFDVIYAYSVFSHLNEQTSQLWVREFARILKSGGMLIVTTLKRAHIGVWKNIMSKPWDPGHHALTTAGFSAAKAEEDFESGRFLFHAIGGGGVRSSDFYGEAIVSPVHVRRAWSPMFDLVDYIGDENLGPQALIVARKILNP